MKGNSKKQIFKNLKIHVKNIKLFQLFIVGLEKIFKGKFYHTKINHLLFSKKSAK